MVSGNTEGRTEASQNPDGILHYQLKKHSSVSKWIIGLVCFPCAATEENSTLLENQTERVMGPGDRLDCLCGLL